MSVRELSPAQQEQLLRLRQLETTLQNLRIQQAELTRTFQEIEMTKKELKDIDPETETWRMVGSVMFPKKAEDILKELTERAELIEVNLKRLSNQEAETRKKFEEIQSKLSGQLGGSLNSN